MHRRKVSREEDVNDVLVPLPSSSPTEAPTIKVMMNGTEGGASASNGSANGTGFRFPPPRTRTTSSPGFSALPSADAAETTSLPPQAPSYRQPPPSAGPYRTGFGGAAPGSSPPKANSANGLNAPASASPYVRSFSIPPPIGIPGSGSHSRTRSVSGYAPAAPSPLASSFSLGSPPHRHGRAVSHANGNGTTLLSAPSAMSPSSSLPSRLDISTPSPPPSLPSPGSDGSSPSRSTPASLGNGFPPQKSPVHQRVSSSRHQRLHSRNLSIFFPRPGSLPVNTIAEDGAQELEFGEGENGVQEAPVSEIPSADSATSTKHPRRLGEGFTFGARPPSSALGDESPLPQTTTARTSRRGHHHKHSVSHNFFSFLEPGANGRPAGEELLAPNPVPTPVSSLAPQTPQTPFSAHSNGSAPPAERTPSHQFQRAPQSATLSARSTHRQSKAGNAREELVGWSASVLQLALGAWVWVSGQAAGSLALTGLGYWVVFDSFGVALAAGLPGYLARRRRRGDVRGKVVGTMYGDGRVEAVALFAQSVYLLFAAVYVCKESVEHMLLSFGQEGKEGHHHHAGDETLDITGISYPLHLLGFTLFALTGTAFRFANHSSIADTAGNRIPSFSDMSDSIRSFRFSTRAFGFGSSKTRHSTSLHAPSSNLSTLSLLLTNPYCLSPLIFLLSIICISAFAPTWFHVTADLGLAFLEAALTFHLAYPAAVAIGTVLLQTAPIRGTADGTMEAFLRAMREIERHPQVLHLPAPHIWQLTPTRAGAAPSLVVTLELHVRQDMDDAGALDLTRWAWERCASAMRSTSHKTGGTNSEPEITVGVVRG